MNNEELIAEKKKKGLILYRAVAASEILEVNSTKRKTKYVSLSLEPVEKPVGLDEEDENLDAEGIKVTFFEGDSKFPMIEDKIEEDKLNNLKMWGNIKTIPTKKPYAFPNFTDGKDWFKNDDDQIEFSEKFTIFIPESKTLKAVAADRWKKICAVIIDGKNALEVGEQAKKDKKVAEANLEDLILD